MAEDNNTQKTIETVSELFKQAYGPLLEKWFEVGLSKEPDPVKKKIISAMDDL